MMDVCISSENWYVSKGVSPGVFGRLGSDSELYCDAPGEPGRSLTEVWESIFSKG